MTRAGSVNIDVRPDDWPRLERWADEHQRTPRLEAAYLVHWALDELIRMSEHRSGDSSGSPEELEKRLAATTPVAA
jgi:hypothetical protein